MKVVFDIDGVICTNTWGNYAKAKPHLEMIAFINKLHDDGNEIIFHSARGFGTCGGVIKDINAKWYDFTVKQLYDWGVKYNFLTLGKPDGQIYVDDKAFRANGNTCGDISRLELYIEGLDANG